MTSTSTDHTPLDEWKKRRSSGHLLLGAMAATSAEAQIFAGKGADFLASVHFAESVDHPFRFLLGLTATGDANTINAATGGIPLKWKPGLPMFSGFFFSDPFVNIEERLDSIKREGFVGVLNYPSLGLWRENIPESTYEASFSFNAECVALDRAGEKGLLRAVMAYSTEEASTYARIGCEIVIAVIPGPYEKPDRQAKVLESLVQAAASESENVLILTAIHPTPDSERLRFLLLQTPRLDGYLAIGPANGPEAIATEVVGSLV